MFASTEKLMKVLGNMTAKDTAMIQLEGSGGSATLRRGIKNTPKDIGHTTRLTMRCGMGSSQKSHAKFAGERLTPITMITASRLMCAGFALSTTNGTMHE
tara:strand:- start:200 stop:499 length:300 start_codon:yes stop_codon:yes gene_type:complete